MSSLLERIKAKQAAKEAAPPAALPAVQERAVQKEVESLPTEVPKAKLEAPPETEVIMGITLEDLQQRIAYVYEHAKTAEKHEIQEDMNGLKRAIIANPSIVSHLLPQDIGNMVACLRKIHSDARAAATVTPAAKRAAKSAEAKAVKDMLKKPLSGDDLNSLLDEL